MGDLTIPGFRQVPQTGVIYVMHQARLKGYSAHDPSWINLGQGAPETGALAGAPPRVETLTIDPAMHEYSPVAGQIALREKVAALYNYLYRRGKTSQYTWENVSISGGGRIALTRIAASLGNINMGHFLPDYTAYEELLSVFKAFVPIPILLDPAHHYQASLEQIKSEIMGRGLKAVLTSNPCNPTGQLIEGEQLKEWVNLARSCQCSLIMDEFYSHYVYNAADSSFNNIDSSQLDLQQGGNKRAEGVYTKYMTDGERVSNNAADSRVRSLKTVSAAEYVEDVNHDPVLIVNGLTKNWRYPGWRISWTLGPKEVIDTLASAGSFLDGGANNPIQNEVLSLLEPETVIQEANILQACFKEKRDYTLQRLYHMGIKVEAEPKGTFYVWANLSGLPEPLTDGLRFFEAGLSEKVITVPGVFFDVNPEKRRTYARFSQYCRISFGPEMSALVRGLDGLERLIKRYR